MGGPMTAEMAIEAYEERIASAQRALRVLSAILEAEGAGTLAWYEKRLDELLDVASVRRNLAEARRPKGPAVRVYVETWAGRDDDRIGELIRRSRTRAWIRDQGSVVEFVLTSRRARSKHLRLYIHEDDLPIVMALPAVQNAVSEALDAMRGG